jgi:hypothetical protein
MRSWNRAYRRILKERRLGQASLSVERILECADAYHAANGRWPTFRSGPVAGMPGETWSTIHVSLRCGRRGLPTRMSLARFLVEHRGRQALNGPPDLTIEGILAWADSFHGTHGQWPVEASGPIADAPRENWKKVSMALLKGGRGLPGGSSLARLLDEHRGVRNPKDLPPLNTGQILAWAEAYHAANGRWPSYHSGPVPEAPGEDWAAINQSLYKGFRGLPGGSSLACLLSQHHPERLRILSLETIRAWAEAHRRAHGVWPAATSGPVEAAPDEDWAAIDGALRDGRRGLPGGLTLAKLFGRSVDPSLIGIRPRLTLEQVLAWGEAHHAAAGRWPHRMAGPVLGVPGEKWVNIDEALRHGRRGLPSGLSLARLFADRPAPKALGEASGGVSRSA